MLGAGRAGTGLARALRASGVSVIGLHGRTPRSGDDAVTAGPLPPSLATATVVLVAVRDAQLDAALRELVAARLHPDAVVLHVSGGADPSALALMRAAGHPAGTFHPLVPLADPARAAQQLNGAWIGIDGDPAACAVARDLAARLGANVVEIPAGAKTRYHAAAVFASNFPIVLAAVAERLLTDAGVSVEAARGATASLLRAAAENLRDAAPRDALTGPVARGDVETVRAHLDALRDEPEVLALYEALTRAAERIVKERAQRETESS